MSHGRLSVLLFFTGFFTGMIPLNAAQAAVIAPKQGLVLALPGDELRVRWMISDHDGPVFGYSLDLNMSATDGALGNVTADAALSNFFDARNLITAGGASRDPLFSVILTDSAGGLFLSTNTDDGSVVTPVSGVNDVLAEFVFVVGTGSEGDFVFELGAGSALSDADGRPVAFTASSLVVRVVPGPGALTVISASLALGISRRRQSI